MNKEFNLYTKEEIKSHIDLQFIRLATELKEEIENNFSKANEKLVTQQVLINTLKARIDKAIKYIDRTCVTNIKWVSYPKGEFFNIDELLHILKGSDTNV